MKQFVKFALGALLGVSLTLGCSSAVAPTNGAGTPLEELAQLESAHYGPAEAALPTPLIEVSVGSDRLEFWPYTGTNFSGSPQDPINLIFYGEADARDIRAALMGLDGSRNIPDLPPVPPFNSTWTDGIGDVQTGYGLPDEWTGSVIQLECGPYDGMRFHIRLFEIGDWTVANAHLDGLIPGTSDHQVLSWELAEQFVVYDFMRTGLLDTLMPIIPTAQINDAPFREIPAMIYNGLPVEVRALIGGPLGNVIEDVPINTDGHAMILNLARRAERVANITVQDFVLQFGQAIPKPFCAGPGDFLWVEGPVHMYQKAQLSEGGVYKMNFEAQGEITAVPIDPVSGMPVGAPLTAYVSQRHSTQMNDAHFTASGLMYQRLGDGDDEGGGRLFVRLRVSADGKNGYDASIRCNVDGASAAAVAAMRPSQSTISKGLTNNSL